MKFRHTFQVKASRQRVAEFHAQSKNMAAITPPPVIVQIHSAPPVMAEGDQMDFTLWFGPFPLRWLARFQNTGEMGFQDVQLKGPFQSWIHTHRFEDTVDGFTRVSDQIEARLKPQFLWRLAGLVMWGSLPLLFAYRAWRTKRLLVVKG